MRRGYIPGTNSMTPTEAEIRATLLIERAMNLKKALRSTQCATKLGSKR